MSRGIAALVACGLLGCRVPPSARPLSSLEYHYRSLRGSAPAVASTRVYRMVAATLSSRCEMWPNDSRYLDEVAARCPARVGLYRSLSRLFVERAASPRFLRPVRVGGALRWVDRSEAVSCR